MDELDRMFRRLVHNIRTLYPDYTTRPFEVAEVYQTLIPYRHNRRELGIDTNEEYELTLMRLLSGERGYVSTDSALQEALRRELGSPNPNTSAFRAYGTAQVRLDGDALRRLEQGTLGASASHGGGMAGGGVGGSFASAAESAAARFAAPRPAATPPPAAPTMAPQPPRPAAPPPMAPAPAAAPAAPPPTRPIAHHPPAAPIRPAAVPPPSASVPNASAPQGGIVAGGSCRYCGGSLPDGRRITFCPHCGQNLTIQHCPACGTELELGWKFCVTCGRSVA